MLMSHALDVDITKDLGKYLGALMIHQRISKHSFSFILDKIRKKLSDWKAKTLSFVGRVTLDQASLLNIPGYVLQSYLIPVFVCDEAEKICRDFIWSSTTDKKKSHLVAWEKLCYPKDDGGLGFHNLKVLNEAHMMKLAWNMISQPNKLWGKIMSAKYSCGIYFIPRFCKKANSSTTWRAIVNAWEDVKPNLI